VTSDGLLLLSSEGSSTLVRPCLIQDLACGSHDSDESLLLSVCGSGGGLSRGHSVVFLRLGDDSLLSVDSGDVGVAARHGRQDGGGGHQ
jgi:hypothetical protein